MRRNFFQVMRIVNKDYENGSLCSSSEKLFSRLIESVESGGFSNSDITKFICQNWKLDYKELTSFWNGLNGTEKSKDTFRSQVSTISAHLFTIFGDVQPSVFGNPNELSSEDISIRERLVAILDSMITEDTFAKNIYILEVLNYFEDLDAKDSFPLSECENELKVLKLLTKSNIYSLLDTCNSAKLKYILSIMIQPLTSNRYRTVNLEKLEIMRNLGLAKTSYSLLKQKQTSDSASKNENTVNEVVDKPSHRFKMGITNEMAETLEKRLAEPISHEDVIAETNLGDKRDIYIKTLVGTLYAMTPEGFERYIARQNPILLAEAINGTFSDHKNVDVDFTGASQETKRFIKYDKRE